MQRIPTAILVLLLLCSVLFTYANHFHNSFHFDDFHAIVENPYIRDIGNIPRFFTDSDMLSVLPSNRAYRPVLGALMTIDYKLGGLNTTVYHASIFFLYLLLLIVLYLLFAAIVPNRYVALFAVALYGLHPACAETVNYIIQGGDVISTLGVAAGLLLYARFENLRRTGVYLIPVIGGILAKPPALIFPAILLAYIVVIEEQRTRLVRRMALAFPVCAAAALFLSWMKPRSFVAGGAPAFSYWITQPFVALHYAASFFLPIGLTADTDRQPFAALNGQAWLGIAFVLAVCVAVRYTSRVREWRPVAFGLCWFVLALIPTAVMPLAEVENDHRMFFPFIGLALAATSTAWLLVSRNASRGRMRLATVTAIGVLAVCAYGAWRRNEVWLSEETLWEDAARKSPHNGRALMNYGLTQMNKGDYRKALEYFDRASELTRNYSILEINLGVVHGALGNDAEAAKHFDRAIQLAPGEAQPYYFDGRWLSQKRRMDESAAQLATAIARNPAHLPARDLLMQVDFDRQDWVGLKKLAAETLQLFPNEATAQRFARAPPALAPIGLDRSPEAYLNRSLLYHRAGQYEECIAAARQALALRPNYAEAYNNIAAAYEAMFMWDEAIQAATHALQIRPDFALARNNLLWSKQQKLLRPHVNRRPPVSTPVSRASGNAASRGDSLSNSR